MRRLLMMNSSQPETAIVNCSRTSWASNLDRCAILTFGSAAPSFTPRLLSPTAAVRVLLQTTRMLVNCAVVAIEAS